MLMRKTARITKQSSRSLAFAAISVALTTTLVGCSDDKAQQQATPPPAVSVFNVVTQEVGNYREFVARTEAFQEVAIRARVEGELIERHFNEGSSVEKESALIAY
ncbi:hypothetical protein [Pseudoalteromonas gelatinilytica]